MWSRPPALSGQCEPSWAGDLCPRDSGLYPKLCPESCWGPGRGPARVRGASAGTFWQGAPWVGPTTKLSGHPVRTQVEGTAPPRSPYGNPPPALALRLRPSAAARAGGERGDLTLRVSGRTARSPQAAQTRRLPRRSAASAAADSAPVGLCAVPGPPRPPCPPPPWSSCCAPSCAPRPCGPSGAPGPAASARGAPTTRTRAPCSSRSTAGRRWSPNKPPRPELEAGEGKGWGWRGRGCGSASLAGVSRALAELAPAGPAGLKHFLRVRGFCQLQDI